MTGMEGQTNGFAERLAKNVEAKIEADSIKNTHNNAVDMVENYTDFFNSKDEDKQSEIATRVLGRFGLRGYKDFNSIVEDSQNTSKNQKVAIADINSIVDSVFITMNMTTGGEDLVTDSMDAEEIDSYLPKQLKGVGKKIKEKQIIDEDKNNLITINKEIDEYSLFTTGSDVARGVAYKSWGKLIADESQNSLIRQYTEVCRSVLSDLGIKNIEEKQINNDEFYIQPEEYMVGREIEGADSEKKGGLGIRWELAPEFAAEAMKYMDVGMHWSSYTPPEWFKKLGKNPDGSVNKEGVKKQARIEYMVMINSAAGGLIYAGKDLNKIVENNANFKFTHEQMSKLFDPDFKLAMSKILNDLCEIKYDQNGLPSLRYKECFYEIDKNGNFVKDKNGKRIILPENEENRNKGIKTIKEEVIETLDFINEYKDKIADFLATQDKRFQKYTKDDKYGHKKGDFIVNEKGERIPDTNYIDKMNAYTAWNIFFAMGDSSLADRMRILPTYEGIISDAIRTLNPEYKALGKWQILKGGKIKEDSALFDSEYFAGPLADYVLKITKLERDLGKIRKKNRSVPIDGKETMRDKIVNGKMPILSNKTVYGFFDFVNGGRDLFTDERGKEKFYEKNNTAKQRQISLGELVMNYANFDRDGNLIDDQRENFTFGQQQVTFMNEFRDSFEGAALAYNCVTGKIKVDDARVWARNLKDKIGMVNGIRFNDERYFNWTRSPEFWRDAIIGSFGADLNRLSSDYIPMRKPTPKNGVELNYASFVYGVLTSTFELSDNDVNLNKLMRLLGVDVDDGVNPDNYFVRSKSKRREFDDIERTRKLIAEQRSGFEYGKKSEKVLSYIERVKNSKKYLGNSDFELLMKSFNRLVDNGDEPSIERLAGLIENFKQ